ncbi:MAG: hypothetical protein MI743_14800 [Sneathiellales bacterium]|nr:hypothetical protein [Sneathiellales bacterium]
MRNDLFLDPEETHLLNGVLHIIDRDPDFRQAIDVITPIPSRMRPAGFKPLVKIIVEQQVSIASANAIWGRLEKAITPFKPETLLSFSETRLRDLGLSKQKAIYCRALATSISEGALSLTSLEQLDDLVVMDHLTQVKGIGRWTAEIYLIACLKRQDIWPAGDVALKVALQHLKKLDTRPSVQEMDLYAEKWRPYRTLAARILWRYYADVVKKKPDIGV